MKVLFEIPQASQCRHTKTQQVNYIQTGAATLEITAACMYVTLIVLHVPETEGGNPE